MREFPYRNPEQNIALTLLGIPILVCVAYLASLILPSAIVNLYVVACAANIYLTWCNSPDYDDDAATVFFESFVVYPIASLLWPTWAPQIWRDWRNGNLRLK